VDEKNGGLKLLLANDDRKYIFEECLFEELPFHTPANVNKAVEGI
jgi:hypothetical protein